MDLLADALSVIHFKGSVYCQTDFTAPWGVDWEERTGHAGFFLVLRGNCYMECTLWKQPLSLRAGDFVLASRAMGYVLRDSLNSLVKRFDDVAGTSESISSHRIIEYGGDGPSTNLLMGCFEIDEKSKNPLVQSLPEFIIIREEEMSLVPWLESTLRFLATECINYGLGASITISRLTELIFVQAVRFHILREMSKDEGPEGRSNWLRGVCDSHIGKAMSCMHEAPHEPWTVASLAHAAGLSRSAFALRFKELTGMTPLDYLTAWRMQKAQKLIVSETSISLAEIAGMVGYQSESAFSKAFKRETGKAPGLFRRGQSTPGLQPELTH